MKKIIVLILSLIISIPFFTFSPSAASYDLGDPKRFNNMGIDNAHLSSGYIYQNGTWDYFNPFNTIGDVGYFYSSRFSSDGSFPYVKWSFGSPPTLYNDFSGWKDITGGTDVLQPILTFYSKQTNFNALYFAGFYYDHLFIPSEGQYLKVDFSFVSQVRNIPDSSLLDLKYLCFLSDGADYTNTIPCSSATLSIDRGYIYNFSFYFKMNSISIDPLKSSEDVRLNFRIPYYNDQQLGQGFYVVSNVNIPTSYEILTVGGYDQAINGVHDAVVKGFDDLDSVLTEQTDSDIFFTDTLNESVSDLKDTVSDYQEKEDIINSIDSSIVLPPLNDVEKSETLQSLELPSFSNLTLLWNDLITEMLILVISLGTAAAILYGKRI